MLYTAASPLLVRIQHGSPCLCAAGTQIPANMSHDMKIFNFFLLMRKVQISCICTVTGQLISTFVFTTKIVQFLYFLNPKFQACSQSSVAVQQGMCRRVYGEKKKKKKKLKEDNLIQISINHLRWRSGAVVRASDFGPSGHWFKPQPVHISLWP